MHPYQNEIWTIADGALDVGAWWIYGMDQRHTDLEAKIILDETKGLYIPAGVAHKGCINHSIRMLF